LLAVVKSPAPALEADDFAEAVLDGKPVRVSAGFVRAALTKPAEQCEVLDNGKLQLVSP